MNHPNLPVFISHAERDAAYLAQFGLHLKNLEKLQLLRVWHSGLIPVGANRQAQIQSQLDEAQIILLLLSPDFLAAPHTWQQLERALQRRDEENVLLLPIYLRPCYWQDHENLRHLQVLPRSKRPINTHADVDTAYTEVVSELAAIVRQHFQLTDAPAPPQPAFSIGQQLPLRTPLLPSPPADSTPTHFPRITALQVDGYYGLLNEQLQLITEFVYEATTEAREGWMGVKFRGRWGFVDHRGQWLIEPTYVAARPFSEGLAAISDGQYWGFVDTRGQVTIPPRYEAVGDFREGHAVVMVNQKLGYLNTRGKLVVPAQYTGAKPFGEGLAKVQQGSQWGFINAQNEVVIPFEYEEAGSNVFAGGLAFITQAGQMGALNRAGEWVLAPGDFPPSYTEFNIETGGQRTSYRCLATPERGHLLLDRELRIIAQLGELWLVHHFYDRQLGNYFAVCPKSQLVEGGEQRLGLCDAEGRVLMPCDLDEITDLGRGLLAGRRQDKWGLLRVDATPLTPFHYEAIYAACDQLVKVEQNRKFGAVDWEGQVIYPSIYEEINIYTSGAILLYKAEKWSFNDRRGKAVNRRGYSEYRLSRGGWFVVKRGERFGFVDAEGAEKIACQYLQVGDFSEGLCWVITEEQTVGFIDGRGQWQIPAEYLGAGPFSEGLAAVAQDVGGWLSTDIRFGYVDRSGSLVIDCRYEKAAVFREGAAPVRQEGKWGFIKKDGTKLTHFIYEEVEYFINGVARVKQNGKWGSITWNKRS